MNGKTKRINIVILPNAKNHSRIAAHSYILKAIETVIIRYPHLDQFGSIDIHLWSDGCSTPNRFRFVFQLTTFFPSWLNLIRYYNEHYHGKEPMVGIGECIKSTAYRAVMAEKIVTKTPLDFTKSALKSGKRNRVCAFVRKRCFDWAWWN